ADYIWRLTVFDGAVLRARHPGRKTVVIRDCTPNAFNRRVDDRAHKYFRHRVALLSRQYAGRFPARRVKEPHAPQPELWYNAVLVCQAPGRPVLLRLCARQGLTGAAH